jgi:hypothetical protein
MVQCETVCEFCLPAQYNGKHMISTEGSSLFLSVNYFPTLAGKNTNRWLRAVNDFDGLVVVGVCLVKNSIIEEV